MIAKTTLAAAAALLALPGLAGAHATIEQAEVPVGATTKITLRVPHGCDGQATHTVRIEIPEGFYAVKPMPKPGWTLTTEDGAYATPYDNHGTEMTDGVRAVTWSDGDLPDAHYDEFTLRGAVGPQLEPGGVLYFPAVQTCADGTADWTDVTGSHEVPNPAPSVTLVAGAAVTLGDLRITTPFARATLPNQPVAGGFMTVANTGTEDDRLVAARSTVAGRMEVHEMRMDGDVMRMREIAGGLAIPAGETVALQPGGYHIMFMDLAGPLAEGDMAEVTLTFERAGEVTLTMPVVARDATPAGATAMDHGTGHGAGDGTGHGAGDGAGHGAAADGGAN